MSKPTALERVKSMAANDGAILKKTVADAKTQLEKLVAETDLTRIQRVYVLGCGTSYFGALSVKHMFEQIAGIPSEGAQAFAFAQYQNPDFLNENSMVVGFSTAGTTEAIHNAFRKCKENDAYSVAITALEDTPIGKLSNATILTGATDETNVVRTKAQVQGVLTMCLLAVYMGRQSKYISAEQADDYFTQIDRCIEAIVDVIENKEEVIKELAYRYKDCESANVLASGPNTGTGQTGSLMITEMAKIHAWGDELENYLHGRDREIDQTDPLLILAPKGAASARTLDFLTVTDHVKANTIVFTDDVSEGIKELATHVVEMKGGMSEIITSIVNYTPFYLFGYHLAEAKGEDPNKRRYMDILPVKVKYGAKEVLAV